MEEVDTTVASWPRDEQGQPLPGLGGETLHAFDGWYCIAWPVRGEWVVSDCRCLLSRCAGGDDACDRAELAAGQMVDTGGAPMTRGWAS